MHTTEVCDSSPITSNHDYTPRPLHAGMGQAIAERTILRKTEDGSFESWEEVAKRVALGNALLCNSESEKLEEQAILTKRVAEASLLMSGRHLQHGDKDQPTRNLEIFTNCSTSPTSFLTFYLLLNGSGVGRSYDDIMMITDWDNAPNLRVVLDDSHPDFDFSAHESVRDATHKYGSDSKMVMWHSVEDSREGWAKALEMWEIATFEKIHKDKMLILDFSKVRAKGSPIGGMQDRPASGPVPLMNAFIKSASLKGSSLDQWKQAMYVDHYFAECVLVGGARRAARMSTKSWDDPSVVDFIEIKRPIEFRGLTSDEVTKFRATAPSAPMSFLWSSNNSVMVDSEFWELLDIKRNESTFSQPMAKHARKVWKRLVECSYGDGTGEPGIINADKLSSNSEGLENLERGDYVGFYKYRLQDETELMMSRLAKRAKKLKYPMITNPCGEISISVIGAYCTIADVVPYHAETIADALDAFRAATRALIRVNTMPCLYQKEVDRTNRIGVGMTGIHEFAWKFFRIGFLDLVNPDFDLYDNAMVTGYDQDTIRDHPVGGARAAAYWMTLNQFNIAINDEAVRYSNHIGVTPPHTTTTIKPAGTTSKLFGLTEGWHLPSMEFYMRWVQFRHDDPLVEKYKAEGYSVRKLTQYEGTVIVGFPTAPTIATLGMGDAMITAGDATPEDQYKWLMLGEKYYIHGVDPVTREPRHDRNTGNQISYCLAGDGRHLIPTSEGMMRIEDMTSDVDTNDRDGESQRVIDLVDNGIKPTKTVVLRNGAEIMGTDQHRILTINANLEKVWKTLGEIVVGDMTVRRVGDNVYSATMAKLPPFDDTRIDDRNGNYTLVSTPDHMSTELGMLIGMLMADGHVGENGIGLTTADENVAQLFESLTEHLFGLSPRRSSDARSDSIIQLNINSRGLSRWFIALGLTDHNHNSIPKCILQSPRTVISRFVSGYTLDGHVNDKGWAHVCSTTSERMASDMQTVLFNMGYDAYRITKKSRMSVTPTGWKGMSKPLHVVYLGAKNSLRFIDDIGFLEHRKNESVAERASVCNMPHKSHSVPSQRLHEHYAAHRDLYRGNDRLRGIMKAKSPLISVDTIRREFPDFVELLGDTNVKFTQVVDVYESEEVHTYDITVDASHEYVANSVVVHNTLKYKPEVTDIKQFRLMMREYQPQIRACSVMPQEDDSAYEYLPEEAVTKAQYEEFVRAIRTKLEEDIGAEHIACVGGACPVDFTTGDK